MPFNNSSSAALTPLSRVFLVIGMSAVIGGFGLAASVSPDPRGFGTHQQFGFPPCTFRVAFGITCPSCGGTTSVAHFVRGEWISSAKANLSVFLLALTALLFLPWAILSLRSQVFWGLREPVTFAVILMLSISLIAMVQWGMNYV